MGNAEWWWKRLQLSDLQCIRHLDQTRQRQRCHDRMLGRRWRWRQTYKLWRRRRWWGWLFQLDYSAFGASCFDLRWYRGWWCQCGDEWNRRYRRYIQFWNVSICLRRWWWICELKRWRAWRRSARASASSHARRCDALRSTEPFHNHSSHSPRRARAGQSAGTAAGSAYGGSRSRPRRERPRRSSSTMTRDHGDRTGRR